MGAVTEPTEVEAAARARVGLRLEGDWTLCEVIGCGGTAAVYRATRSDGSVGAAKVMHSHLAGDRGWLRRLAREAELLRTLEHPGLVRLLYIGTTEGVTPFLVTELLQGHSLDVLRKQAVSRRMPLPDVLKYAREILGALTHAHALGVVHRDLKPSNVFITTDGHVKVLDFGIAAGGDLVAPDDGSRSATRGLLGTPAYMAPEQARARWDFVDHRTDLWAVGAIMFTLLTGEFVHVAVTENERLGLAMSRRARSIASVMRGLDTELVRVVDRALEYDSSERFQSAIELGRALDAAEARFGASPVRATSEATWTQEPEPARVTRRPLLRPGYGVLAGSALVLLAGLAFGRQALLWNASPFPAERPAFVPPPRASAVAPAPAARAAPAVSAMPASSSPAAAAATSASFRRAPAPRRVALEGNPRHRLDSSAAPSGWLASPEGTPPASPPAVLAARPADALEQRSPTTVVPVSRDALMERRE